MGEGFGGLIILVLLIGGSWFGYDRWISDEITLYFAACYEDEMHDLYFYNCREIAESDNPDFAWLKYKVCDEEYRSRGYSPKWRKSIKAEGFSKGSYVDHCPSWTTTIKFKLKIDKENEQVIYHDPDRGVHFRKYTDCTILDKYNFKCDSGYHKTIVSDGVSVTNKNPRTQTPISRWEAWTGSFSRENPYQPPQAKIYKQ